MLCYKYQFENFDRNIQTVAKKKINFISWYVYINFIDLGFHKMPRLNKYNLSVFYIF